MTGMTGLMRGMATLPQGNHELLMVKYKVGRPPPRWAWGKQVHFSILCLDIVGWATGRASGL